jgi:hypothetical protein
MRLQWHPIQKLSYFINFDTLENKASGNAVKAIYWNRLWNIRKWWSLYWNFSIHDTEEMLLLKATLQSYQEESFILCNR